MAEYTRIAVDPEVVEQVTKLAREATHIDDLAPGRAIEWIVGEYRRIKERNASIDKIFEKRIRETIGA